MAPIPYTPGGRAHRILRRLATGDASFRELIPAAGLAEPVSNTKRKGLWRLVNHLHVLTAVGRTDRGAYITPAGRALLAELETQLDATSEETPT